MGCRFKLFGNTQIIAIIMSTENSKTKKPCNIDIVNGCAFPEISEKCKEIVTCDTARISKPLDDGKMFLIVGFNRSTKDDEGQWVDENGERRDFDYVQESVIASGFTEKELINSTKEYVKLCGMTWEEYFADLLKTLK